MSEPRYGRLARKKLTVREAAELRKKINAEYARTQRFLDSEITEDMDDGETQKELFSYDDSDQ